MYNSKKITKVEEFDNGIIARNFNTLGGELRISGTRIPVSLIIACLRDDMSLQDICEDYDIDIHTLKEVLNNVIEILSLI